MLATGSRPDAVAALLETVALLGRRLTASRTTPFGDIRLTRSQVDTLFLLAHGRDPVTPGGLASTLALTAGAVTQLVDGLRAAGLVEQAPHPSDARSRTLQLTPTAREQVEIFERQVVDRMAPMFDDLSDDELLSAAALLARVH